MKNMKIAAAAMVMVMLASAAIVGIGASTYDADDDTTPTYEYKVNLSNNDTVTVELMSNINYYSALGGASISWEVNGETTITDLEKKYTKNNVSITPSVIGSIIQSVEKLTVDVKKETGETEKTTSFLLTATIEVTKGTTDGTSTNTATVTLESISYKIDVIIDDANDVTFGNVKFVKNVSKTVTLSIDNREIDTNNMNSIYYNAKFYATGLPAGLSMTPDGKISGIPTEPTNKQVIIFIEKTNGTVIKGSLDIEVADFLFTVTSAKNTGADTSLTGNNGTYIVEQGDTLSVTTVTEGANYISVCNQNGASTLVSINSNNTCDLRNYTAGTGAYKVYIGYADGDSPTYLSKVLASFDLYVVGHVAGVGSDIIIGSR